MAKPSYFLKWSREIVQRATDNGDAVSLYVENIAEAWEPANVYRIMSKYGEVMDVYVPSKRARNGLRFCFVRFRGVRDLQRLLGDVNRIQVEQGRVRANLAKGRGRAMASTRPRLFRRALRKEEQCYSDVMQPRHAQPQAEQAVQPSAETMFIPTSDTLSWLARCIVGVLKDPTKMDMMPMIWSIHRLDDVMISELGGDRIVACFPSKEAMAQFMGATPEWVQLWFQTLTPWNHGMRAVNRRRWLTLRGVPLNAWYQEFFDMVGSVFGRLIQIDTDTANRRFLGDACIQVLTEQGGVINRTMDVTVGGKKYKIDVVESCFTAMKDKISSGDQSESGSDHSEPPSESGSDHSKPPSESEDGGEKISGEDANQEREDNGDKGDSTPVMGSNANLGLKCAVPIASPTHNLECNSELGYHITPPRVSLHTTEHDASPSLSNSASGSQCSTQQFHGSFDACYIKYLENRLAKAIQSRRVHRGRKIKKVKDNGSVVSADSSIHSDIRRVNLRLSQQVVSQHQDVSFQEVEAQETVAVGDSLGWDNSGNQQIVVSMAETLVEKEACEWSKACADV
ncbi:hypothetical protein Tsubulata_039728 [Turnera subulata]|uniref:RRM domain-containing protein n=1 Tax=Turnera subulata TaxID=218843 RepID=A0A9Q0G3Y2_9ROSI|nr:hypothetical protein Tsubulata_039728 [Turnera subulata]